MAVELSDKIVDNMKCKKEIENLYEFVEKKEQENHKLKDFLIQQTEDQE